MAPRKGTRLFAFTQSEIDLALDLYALGLSSDSVSEVLDRSPSGVRNIILRHGKPRVVGHHLRKFHPRGDAFAHAEGDENAAYWVGFLMADGCILERPNREWTIVLELQKQDREHVVAFAQFAGVPESCVTAGQHDQSFRVRVSSQEMANDLASYGVVPRKSLIAEPRRLLDDRHFWRGIVDGDGCLSIATVNRKYERGKRAVLTLAGSEKVMQGFEEFVRRVSPGCDAVRARRGNIWTWATTGSHAATVVRYLYDGCEVALARKKRLASEIAAMGLLGYETTAQEQSPHGQEPRGRRFLTCGEETKTVAAWARATGIPVVTILARLRYGWSEVKAVGTPVVMGRRKTLICTRPDCGRPHAAKGLCKLHYKRQRRGKTF